MLEKLGLPPKPSLRGNTWVVDSSHCQGCSSPFTFINRKHHCRRCGGIFCNSCTQQRMVLRGQGDSPVRICEPCKKLEEAARFEMRHGHKNRAAKGGSKSASKQENELLNQILGNDDKVFSRENTSTSCSYIPEGSSQVEGEDIVRSMSLNQPADMLTDVGPTTSTTPENLRQQALVEKKKYKSLKAEGKSEEALRAFKRGKELERQAGALEISLRKNRRKALSSSSNIDDSQQIRGDFKAPADKNKKSKRTDDLSAELKDLGWSEQDLRETEKKPATLSLEGELFSLLREVSQKPTIEKPALSFDKSQVIAHKKKALELKRAGNLVEAKEELKRAKILERKIEEEELLGEADDSDDELSSLIRSMDGDEHNGLSARHISDHNVDFDPFTAISDDLAVDGNFEVTDEDMYDPEMNSALKSLGWMEDDSTAYSEDLDVQVASPDRESLVTEIQSLKRESLNQKRAGNSTKAMELLKKAKLLEKELENSEEPIVSAKASVNDTLAPKSKLVIQKELLSLKKKALSLRREGRLDESAAELEKAKVLEEQLEAMNNTAPPVTQQQSIGNRQSFNSKHTSLTNEDEEDVTDQDMHDPAYLSLLNSLGWEDEVIAEKTRSSKYMSDSTITQSVVTNIEAGGTSRKSKSEIQRELLTLKRKALTLRRQGEAEEADQVLEMAKLLEAKLHDSEEPTRTEDSPENNKVNASTNDALQNTKPSSLHQVKLSLEKPDELVYENAKPYIHESHSSSLATVTQPHFSSLEEEIMAYKRKAIALKRDGKLAEAKEALRQAKLLEKSTEDVPQKTITTNSSDASEASPSSVSKPLSSRDRFKLQQESLGHKRQALKLRREGKTSEADAEFELAKAIESRLQESDPPDSSEPVDDVMVEEFLDPQLLSALQSIGLDDGQARSKSIERPRESEKLNEDATVERQQLVERIKTEKVKAVNLKRSGKQADALDALRRAKLYEKKLQSLAS